MVGLTDSPYNACRVVIWDIRVALGDMWGLNNRFGWQKVLVNLQLKITHDFQHPWVYKESRYELIVDNSFVHVDDGQPI